MRVAVIGGGASGLTAAKQSLAAGHEVKVFEESSDVGGVWLYSDDSKTHSAMYTNLVTNMPKQLMEFPDFPFGEQESTFMESDRVWNYLKSYSEGIPVEFNTKVKNMSRWNGKWKIDMVKYGKEHSDSFDVVFICTGHHVQPHNVIDVSDFTGNYIHSHDYRRAADFRNQRVAVVGTGLSGMDISLQLADVARQVVLIGHKHYENLPENISFVQGHVTGATGHSILLDDDRVDDVEVLMDCSGYRYSYPFLGAELVQITNGGKMVNPLWMFIAHREFPQSLFFIGLNELSLTMPIYFYQVQFALALISGRLAVPSYQEMEQWDRDRLERLKEQRLASSDFHKIPFEQYDYLKELANLGQFAIKENLEMIEKLNVYVDEKRNSHVTGYKRMHIITTENNFTVDFK